MHRAAESQVHPDAQVGRYSFVDARGVIYPGTRIGRFCSIGRGCEIGDGPIVAVNAVVSRDVAPYDIVAGAHI